ncbi:NAD(+)/NADH kinase [Natronorubrum texcoconense]|uniref:NAD+ kinase n=1 Tax=Natronorubrum texcoconense TaxID=1095776 RepID=A0A1G8XHH0_9EURY|nr:NAD(+)/NADH kinase [Natronorubrum texcoconense]SDJ89847.1 NAD+ kinase [Natronorubrum texcoconense]
MDAAWSGAEQPVVGIVDSRTATPSDVEPAASDRGATTVRGDLETVLAAEPSLLVTAGETDLSAVARAHPGVPVLPIGDVDGIDTVSAVRAPAALEAVLEGDATVRRHSVLGIEIEDDESADDTRSADDDGSNCTRERALFDVTLVTDEPARISEYGVESRGESVSTFRADGVVVATPAGSYGYSSALEAPHLASSIDAVVVSPIAPFATRTRRWVLPDDEVALTVERDEGDVTLVVDDRSVRTVGVGSRVRLGVDGALSTFVVSDDGVSTNGE